MDKFYNDKLHALEVAINDLEVEADNSIQMIEAVISLIIKCLAEIKDYVLKTEFKNTEEEIHFFKYQKPAIVSKLIFYNTIYKIEAKKPYGGSKLIRKYLNGELRKLKRYFDNNLEFYKYYRTNSSFLDDKLFVRGKYDVKLSLDTCYFLSDQSFSTSHDYKVAKIIANDLIQVYLEDQLNSFNHHQVSKQSSDVALNWTGSKTSMIELIYALHHQGVFDNGNSDIRIIAKYFENTFNVDLGNFYHTYLELRNRKVNRTKFLDALRDDLIKKMDEQDEK